jgi:hypothetical protein
MKLSTRVVRVFTATVLAGLVIVLGTLHAVGYRVALARVEDYIDSFRADVPGAFEPYGLNHLIKTTRVRYNDAVYQVSFSTTAVSTEEVIEAYSRVLAGGKLVESAGDGQVRTLYHSDGTKLTVVRAMPVGGESGTLVQKVFAIKSPRRSADALQDLPELPDLARLAATLKDRSPARAEDRKAAEEVVRDLWTARTRATSGQRLREDRPGFDIEGVPRFPGALRDSSMALEDGHIQIARYLVEEEPESVAHYYRNALPESGWSADPVAAAAAEDSRGSDARHLVYSKGETSLNVLVTPSDAAGRTAVTVMVQ